MVVSTKVRRLGSCNGATSTTRHPSNVSRVCRLCACCAVSSYFDLFAVFTVIMTHSDWRSENYSRFASSMVPLILPNSTNRGLGTEGCVVRASSNEPVQSAFGVIETRWSWSPRTDSAFSLARFPCIGEPCLPATRGLGVFFQL